MIQYDHNNRVLKDENGCVIKKDNNVNAWLFILMICALIFGMNFDKYTKCWKDIFTEKEEIVKVYENIGIGTRAPNYDYEDAAHSGGFNVVTDPNGLCIVADNSDYIHLMVSDTGALYTTSSHTDSDYNQPVLAVRNDSLEYLGGNDD